MALGDSALSRCTLIGMTEQYRDEELLPRNEPHDSPERPQVCR